MEATSLPRLRAPLLPRRLLVALDDERLVEHLRRGNETAFEVIYDRHHRGILAYARHLLGSPEEAEDAVQHTFAAAHSALAGEDRDIRLKPWLYTIARNRCLSVLRARREQPAELDEISTAGLSEEVQQRDDLRALLADLRDLPEPQRAALVLAEVADLAHAEIAHVLGCDVSKVKSLVFQARSGLIERRQARETPCLDIREQLSVLRGGSLRRGPLRRHLKACPGCAAYREEVRRQRQMLAVALPVIPTIGLKESALAAAGIGGGGAAAAAGGAGAGAAGLAASGGAASGGLATAAAALSAKAGVAKVALAVVAGGAALGGGTVAVTGDHTPAQTLPAAAPERVPASGAPGPLGGAPAIAPVAGEERGERTRRRRATRGEGATRPARRPNGQSGERRGRPAQRSRDRTAPQGRQRRSGRRGARPERTQRRGQAAPRQTPQRLAPRPRTQPPAQAPARPAPPPAADEPTPMAAPVPRRRAPAQGQLTPSEE